MTHAFQPPNRIDKPVPERSPEEVDVGSFRHQISDAHKGAQKERMKEGDKQKSIQRNAVLLRNT